MHVGLVLTTEYKIVFCVRQTLSNSNCLSTRHVGDLEGQELGSTTSELPQFHGSKWPKRQRCKGDLHVLTFPIVFLALLLLMDFFLVAVLLVHHRFLLCFCHLLLCYFIPNILESKWPIQMKLSADGKCWSLWSSSKGDIHGAVSWDEIRRNFKGQQEEGQQALRGSERFSVVWGGLQEGLKVRTRLTTARDRNLQFRDTVSTGFFESSPVDFYPFSPGFLCNLLFCVTE